MKNKVINKKRVKVQTHSWDTFGNNIAAAIHALAELIHNAYAACMTSHDKRIKVEIVTENDETYLFVKNSGSPADIEKVLHYGKKNHGTVLNQFGTGFKTAASFFNPTNDGWAFFTKDGEHVFCAEAPYAEEMDIKEIKSWPFEESMTSVVKIRIDDPNKLEGITAKEIGYHYSLAILKDNLNIFFNGEKVKAIMPKGASKTKSETINICGIPAKFDYTIYDLGEDSKAEEYYAMGMRDQGIYVFVNHCLALKAGPKLISKSGKGNSFMNYHPALNSSIAIVDIMPPTDHSIDIPFTNAKNNIDWHKATGREYRKAIDSLVGDHFRDRHDNTMEARKRRILDGFSNSLMSGIVHYNMEYSVSKELKADAVIGTSIGPDGKIIPESIIKLLEFKKDRITAHDVGQSLSYYVALNKRYNINPSILLVGQRLAEDAKNVMNFLQSTGIEISFYDMSHMKAA